MMVSNYTVRLHGGIKDKDGYEKYFSIDAYNSASETYIPGMMMEYNDLTEIGWAKFNVGVKWKVILK